MIKAIDLFSGIGGIRLGFKNVFKNDIKFVYANDIDKFACQTYEANFGEYPIGDITKTDLNSIPDFDLLLAGFPCQSFSIAGKQRGFEDIRGTLFFYIVKILELKKPAYFMLENVKNLMSHDKGKTFNTMKNILTGLGYQIHYTILNAKNYGLPQNRERVYIMGFKDKVLFNFPTTHSTPKGIFKILENNVQEKYYISQRYWEGLKTHRARNEAKGNGFGYKIISPNGIANTIVCGGSGRERNLIQGNIRTKNKDGIRMMTPREWARLQGFPEEFKFPCSNTQTYKQLANSVPIPVIEAIAIKMMVALNHKL